MNEKAIEYAKKYMGYDLLETDFEMLPAVTKHRQTMLEDRSVSQETKNDILINYQF